MPANSGYTLSIECILREAKFRWLKGYEVLCILQNFQQYGLQLSPAAPVDPQSGSLFLFNKRLVKFRKDGVNWRKQKDGKTVRESHEKLKVGGVKVLSCCYTRSADNLSFQRRIYWLLDGDPTTVLVHYLTIDKDCGKEEGLCENSDEVETPYTVRSTLYLSNENNEEEKEESDEPSEISGDEGGESPSSSANNGDTPYGMNESLMDFVNSLMNPIESVGGAPELSGVSACPTHCADLTPSSSLGTLAKISDFSPEWDYIDGGTKILIMGPDFHSGLDYYVMFDQHEVPAELLQDGVLRCRTPAHFKPGFVSFCVTRGNFILFSEVCHFEYRSRESPCDLMNMNERSFKLRIIERLERLEREVNSGNVDCITLSESIMDTLSQTMEDKYLTEQQLENVFVKILVNLMENIDNKDTLNEQDRDGFTLLHYACALRYHVLASTLIQYGASINMQDHNGNTAFHWAIKNNDPTMIKTLVDYVDLSNPYALLNPSTKTEYLSPKIPSHGVSLIDGIISGIDELGLPESNGGTPQASPLLPHLKAGCIEAQNQFKPSAIDVHLKCRELEGSPRSSPNSPLTPHTRMRRTVIKQEDDDENIQTPFSTYRSRRMEKAEDNSKKRITRARGDLLISHRRK